MPLKLVALIAQALLSYLMVPFWLVIRAFGTIIKQRKKQKERRNDNACREKKSEKRVEMLHLSLNVVEHRTWTKWSLICNQIIINRNVIFF